MYLTGGQCGGSHCLSLMTCSQLICWAHSSAAAVRLRCLHHVTEFCQWEVSARDGAAFRWSSHKVTYSSFPIPHPLDKNGDIICLGNAQRSHSCLGRNCFLWSSSLFKTPSQILGEKADCRYSIYKKEKKDIVK